MFAKKKPAVRLHKEKPADIDGHSRHFYLSNLKASGQILATVRIFSTSFDVNILQILQCKYYFIKIELFFFLMF